MIPIPKTEPIIVTRNEEALAKSEGKPMLRVWKLGNLEQRVFPTPAAIQKLGSLLQQWDGKSPLDLIWGPELELVAIDLSEKAVDVVCSADTTITIRATNGSFFKRCLEVLRGATRWLQACRRS